MSLFPPHLFIVLLWSYVMSVLGGYHCLGELLRQKFLFWHRSEKERSLGLGSFGCSDVRPWLPGQTPACWSAGSNFKAPITTGTLLADLEEPAPPMAFGKPALLMTTENPDSSCRQSHQPQDKDLWPLLLAKSWSRMDEQPCATHHAWHRFRRSHLQFPFWWVSFIGSIVPLKGRWPHAPCCLSIWFYGSCYRWRGCNHRV